MGASGRILLRRLLEAGPSYKRAHAGALPPRSYQSYIYPGPLHGPALSTRERAALFIACICACPNLNTSLKIVSPGCVHSRHIRLFTRVHTFPSIRKVVLPDMLAPILSSFPHIQIMMCGEDSPTAGFRLMQAARNYCPHLEEVAYAGSSRVMIGWICVATPKIQRLILRNTLYQDDFAFMRTLTNLCYLEFAHRTDPDGLQGYLSLEDCLKNVRALLGPSRNSKPKTIKVNTLRGRTGEVEKAAVVSMP
ncbi:hypothetical protein C8R47DRAFT_403063 [Mycena vitilis]|nr:hypothetical protein C8R47DRAFT_403063 [Mycena vitilis]